MLEKLKSLYWRWKDDRISMSKQRQFINVESTSKFSVETKLILGWLWKTILFLYLDAWKIKIFILTLKRWPYSTSNYGIKRTSILTSKHRWFWFDTKIIFVLLHQQMQHVEPISKLCRHVNIGKFHVILT